MTTYEIEDISGKLFWEVLWLNGKWKIYKQIYLDEKARETLRKSGLFHIFKFILNSLIIDICLTINRLLDPEYSFNKNRNICFKTLISEVSELDNSLSSRMENKLEKISEISKDFTYLRNKTIAHTDFNLHINLEDFEPIKPKADQIELIIEKLSDLMNYFIQYFERRPVIAFDKFSMSHDGNDIIDFLYRSIEEI